MSEPTSSYRDWRALQEEWREQWREGAHHVGRHKYRLLANAPHPVTGLPTFVGCEKCGKPWVKS